MAQLFRPRANTIARILLLGFVFVPLIVIGLLLVLVRSDYLTGQNRTVPQPVAFSHRHHTAEIGIDCRYCHTSVETSARAGLPPTTTCMSCHSQLFTDAKMLAPVRESLAKHRNLTWNPVNALPDYVYFNHSIHIAKQVACTTCHGAVGTMNLTRQHAPLTMQWCLDCHRDPGPQLSAASEVFDPLLRPESSLALSPVAGSSAALAQPGETPAPVLPAIASSPPQKSSQVRALPLDRLTECSTCHR